MNKAIETLKVARAEAVREYDEAIAKLSPQKAESVTAPATPKAKAAATEKPKRVRSEETKAKHLATLAAKKKAKLALMTPPTDADLDREYEKSAE